MGTRLPEANPGPLRVTIGDQLLGVGKCPHCAISNPTLRLVWNSRTQMTNVGAGFLTRADGKQIELWSVYTCATCGSVVTAVASQGNPTVAERVYPSIKMAHEDLPDSARIFLQQAFNTLQAPDAAAMTAGSAVDAMLKALGYKDGSLYSRIDKARDDHLLTQGMADWAHEVRLGSNRPRHSDENRPHVSLEEAKQSVEFAEALGQFLFVLTAKMDRAILKAKEISEN